MAYYRIPELALHDVGVKSHSHKSIRGMGINIKNQNVFGIDSSLINLFLLTSSGSCSELELISL